MRKWIVNKVLTIDKGDTGGGADAASKIAAARLTVSEFFTAPGCTSNIYMGTLQISKTRIRRAVPLVSVTVDVYLCGTCMRR